MTDQQFLEYLTYYANNQKLWFSRFPATDAPPEDLAPLITALCAQGQPNLALHAVYASRHSGAVGPALESMFIALLTEKAEREGVESLKNMFLQKLQNAQQPKSNP